MAIEVVEKTFSVLEFMARHGQPLPLGELAAGVGLPKPTLYRILRTLRNLGYVEQREVGEYALTERLVSLGRNDRFHHLTQLARPLMQRLHAEFDETVNLGLLEGTYTLYADVIETTQALRWIVKPGVRDPFHTTALGRAIAAGLPEERRSRLVAKADLAHPVARRIKTRAALQRILEETRRRGWAVEEEETVTGVACLAFSLQPWGEPLAAISVSMPINRYNERRRAALVAAFAELRAKAPAAAVTA
ncbi:MAG: IclR family transcriptional regulator [Opitutaceae bacterium]|nr:IclR family transcriptional regulator [Opitutaceae bacterium]